MNESLVAAALCAVSLGAAGCTESSSDPGSERAVVNQFGARSDDLTLSDGGTCPVVINPAAELMIRDLPVVEDPFLAAKLFVIASSAVLYAGLTARGVRDWVCVVYACGRVPR